MNSKLIRAAAAALLLVGSGAALADSWKDRGGHRERGRSEHRWDDRGAGHSRGHWGHHRHWSRHHQHHYSPRWHGPRHYHGHPGKYRSYGPRYGYDDGVTIIFKGRID
jgi:hypothetical protein